MPALVRTGIMMKHTALIALVYHFLISLERGEMTCQQTTTEGKKSFEEQVKGQRK